MKFRYHKLLLDRPSSFFGYSILKPIIPIKIVAGKEEIEYAALIDSGADFCILDAEIGEYLGLNIKDGSRIEFGGIQERGGAEAFLHKVTLNIGGWDYKVEVGFSYDIAKQGFGILGQKGFFDIFIVKFDYLKEEIELKPRDG
ncbi:MAG: Uncharacterized protein G01um101430_765 [Parcubacteria group bacterium Gr01-1014_30]|nr:MAG: Uncharacterized protein G01um101430_765 [Parcubacteria group bacterium Gr01-1014_30]